MTSEFLLPEMVTIPAGIASIGATEPDRFANDTERPQHEVEIAAFALGRFPVTVAQYQSYDPGHAVKEPASWPVVDVSWADAQGYCAWLRELTQQDFRLPTEGEWEYACRAGTLTAFFYGDEIGTDQANFLFDEHGHRIGVGARTDVGQYPANGFGLQEMHGNVCEWVADLWRSSYQIELASTSTFSGNIPEDALRVIRGGAWDYLPRLLRSAWRDRLPASAKRDNLGFRIAVSQ